MSKRSASHTLRLFIVTIAVILLGVLYYSRDIANTYYYDGTKTAGCQADPISSGCNLNVVHLQTVTGDDVYFRYDKSKLVVENKTGRLSGFAPLEKVQVTPVGNGKYISKIRAAD
jgi:hypothetical protein